MRKLIVLALVAVGGVVVARNVLKPDWENTLQGELSSKLRMLEDAVKSGSGTAPQLLAELREYDETELRSAVIRAYYLDSVGAFYTVPESISADEVLDFVENIDAWGFDEADREQELRAASRA